LKRGKSNTKTDSMNVDNFIQHLEAELLRRTDLYCEKLDEHVSHYSKMVIGKELEKDEILIVDSPGIGRHFYEHATRKCFMFEAEPELEPDGVRLAVTAVNYFKNEE